MYKHEVEKFANFEVYTYGDDNQIETLCLCDTGEMARIIAKNLTMHAKKPNLKIYVTGINYPGDFVPGGGWYDVFWRDEEGKLKSSGLG